MVIADTTIRAAIVIPTTRTASVNFVCAMVGYYPAAPIRPLTVCSHAGDAPVGRCARRDSERDSGSVQFCLAVPRDSPLELVFGFSDVVAPRPPRIWLCEPYGTDVPGDVNHEARESHPGLAL